MMVGPFVADRPSTANSAESGNDTLDSADGGNDLRVGGSGRDRNNTYADTAFSVESRPRRPRPGQGGGGGIEFTHRVASRAST